MTASPAAPRRSLLGRLALRLRALGDGLVLLMEGDPRVQAVGRLSRLTDKDLAARGTSREAEVRRIAGAWL